MNRRSIEEIPDEGCAASQLLQPRRSGKITHTRRWWTSGAADGAKTSAVYGDLDVSRISLLEGAGRRGGTADLGLAHGHCSSVEARMKRETARKIEGE
jgi:hypothetical protein